MTCKISCRHRPPAGIHLISPKNQYARPFVSCPVYTVIMQKALSPGLYCHYAKSIIARSILSLCKKYYCAVYNVIMQKVLSPGIYCDYARIARGFNFKNDRGFNLLKKQANKQANKQTSKQTNKQTKKQCTAMSLQ